MSQKLHSYYAQQHNHKAPLVQILAQMLMTITALLSTVVHGCSTTE